MRIKINSWTAWTSSERVPTELIHDAKKWRCLVCCHVRTATIFLGIWHMGVNILGLAVISALMMHPEVLDARMDAKNMPVAKTAVADMFDDLDVPTSFLPKAMSDTDPKPLFETSIKDDSDKNPEPLAMPVGDEITKPAVFASLAYVDLDASKPITQEYLSVKAGLTLITLVISALLVHGTMKVKPSFLMPFFGIQVCDFFISCVSTFGFLTRFPDDIRLAAAAQNLTVPDELLDTNPQVLKLLAIFVALGSLYIKGFFVSVVWNCYKYLTLCKLAMRNARTLHYGDVEGQSFSTPAFPSGDLPDYATAVNDPRFAKSALFPAPPPPYAAVVAETEEPASAQPQPDVATSADTVQAPLVDVAPSGSNNEAAPAEANTSNKP